MKNEKGLTLLELCLVLIIVGLIVAAVSPRFLRTHQSMRMKMAVNTIAQEVESTLQRAIFTGVPWRLRLADRGKTLVVEKHAQNEAVHPGSDPLAGPWRPFHRLQLQKGITIVSHENAIPCLPVDGFPDCILQVEDEKGHIYAIKIKGYQVATYPLEMASR